MEPMPQTFAVAVYTARARGLAALARIVAGGTLLGSSAWVGWAVLAGAWEGSAESVGVVLLGVAGPAWLLERLLQHFAHAELHLDDNGITLHRRVGVESQRWPALRAAKPWSVPLPGPGLTLRSDDGAPLRLRLDDPAPLLAALRQHKAELAQVRPAPGVIYASARAATPRRGPLKFAVTFVVFPLLPALIVFRLHQVITFGGPLGEYHRDGLGALVRSFAHYWVGAMVYMLLFAALVRALAEIGAWAAARWLPHHARGARRLTEWGCAGLYFVGVPALIVWRILV